MNSSLPFVSVIVPTFNDRDCLQRCLQALSYQSYPPDSYEIVVVDNSPSPNPRLPPLMAEFPTIVLAYEPRRGSYAARNHGLHLAQGSVIAFTDDDCVPALDWLEKGVDWLIRHPDCGLVAGRIRTFARNPDAPTAAELYDSRHFLQQKTYVARYHFGATANLFTFKSRFDSVGLFNSDLYSGGDREWGERVFAAGYPLLYANDVVIDHPARHSLRELCTKTLRVTIGTHYLERTNHQSFAALLAEALPQIRPHLSYARDRWEDPSIQGWQRKLGCYFIYLVLRYIKWGKHIQLYLSYHWLRPLKAKLK